MNGDARPCHRAEDSDEVLVEGPLSAIDEAVLRFLSTSDDPDA
jgi:hypothetical protein